MTNTMPIETPVKNARKNNQANPVTVAIPLTAFDQRWAIISAKENERSQKLKVIKNEVIKNNLLKALKKFDELMTSIEEFRHMPVLTNAVAAYIEKPANPAELLELLIILSSFKLWPLFTIKAFSSIGAAKQNVFNALVKIDDVNVKYQLLWQALSPDTFIGALFYTKRWFSEPSIEKGTLNAIACELRQLVLLEKPDLKINEKTLEVLRYENSLEMTLRSNFSALSLILRNSKTNLEAFSYTNPARLFYSPIRDKPHLQFIYSDNHFDCYGRFIPPQTHKHPFLQDDEPLVQARRFSIG